MNIKLTILFALLFSTALFAQPKDFAKWVNPFIGTGGHGHTFPGATMPFGMVQLSPDTRIDNWDGSSGYHYSDDIIYGFSHTHLSGTGIPDGCDILFMPTVGEPQFFAKEGDKSVNGYASKFSHANEKAETGYYSVKLDDDGILAEITATNRVGFHRYSFSETDSANLILDLVWRDKLKMSSLTIDGKRIEGYRKSTSWAKDQTVYFAGEFSEYFAQPYFGPDRTYPKGSRAWIKTTLSDQLKVAFPFGKKRQVLLKVAISYVSIEGARKNLEAELPHWNFDKVRADARTAWNKELSKIEVSGGTTEQTTNFYTALYHTMIQPNVFNDVDGKYRGHDGKVHQLPGYAAVPLAERRSSASPAAAKSSGGYAAGFEQQRQSRANQKESPRKSIAFPLGKGRSPNPQSAIRNPRSQQYSVFSLWDTFRAAHPLYTIIDQKRTVDFINTFIRQYEQGGRLPVWELWGEETDTMIGYHAVSVIADAMAKGIKGFGYAQAYLAARHSADLDHFGLAAYKKRGYISMEDENESVSRTLEYAYNDWCIAQMARILYLRDQDFLQTFGKKHETDEPSRFYSAEYQKYSDRARYFENLFDQKTGFFRPKKNGGFVEPFAPNEVTFGFTEGNSWQYSFFVPHDVVRLMQLHGGPQKFAAKLDELFTTSQKLAGREQADLTGLIGQYAHGNEPSHHIAYLYNYTGQPWKTQMYVRKIMDEFYKNAPDGLIGNEDCGQMSAWYIMSALGSYPVAPGEPDYAVGTPLFREAKINLENGRTFIVKAPNVSATNKYVKAVKVNGRKLDRAFLLHGDFSNGGVLEFEMSDKPERASMAFPMGRGDVLAERDRFVAVPVIDGGGLTFRGKTKFTISTLTPDVSIFYTLDGSEPTAKSRRYDYLPVDIDATTTVKAAAFNDQGDRSFTTLATFIRRPNDWAVKIASPYSTQYTGGGDDGIIDGIRGSTNFASGEWQGYQGKPFEAVIDLQRETEIKQVGGSFLQVAGPWIWMPDRVEFETSADGVSFTKAAEIRLGFPQREMTPTIREVIEKIAPVRARYVRVRALNFGKIPAWHPGAGGDPWIFVDEVFIR